MQKRFEMFDRVVQLLDQLQLLDNLILIGGWCLYLYKIYFDNAPEIPVLRTMDIDILVPHPFKIKNEVNVGSALEQLGFTAKHSLLTGDIKFVHPDLEIEFLTPEFGRGTDKPFQIKKLHISAQKLRYLNLLQSQLIVIPYKGKKLKVPQPAAYVLHKFLLASKRKNQVKKKKDLQVARELGEFLLQKEHERDKLTQLYKDLPRGWKRTIEKMLSENSRGLYDLVIQKEDF